MSGIYGDLGRQEEGGVKSDMQVSALFLSTDPHLFVLLNVKYGRTDFILFCFILFYCILFHFILFLAALGLRCCVWAFSSCGERGLLFIAVRGLPIVVVSLVAEHGL